jgi:hypothetical protein
MPTTHVEREQPGEEQLYAFCRGCGDPFWLNRPWQTHCSTRCRRRLEKRRERRRLKRASVDALPAVVGIQSHEREFILSRPAAPARRPAGRIQALFDPHEFDTIVGFVDSHGNDVPEQFWPPKHTWSRYL